MDGMEANVAGVNEVTDAGLPTGADTTTQGVNEAPETGSVAPETTQNESDTPVQSAEDNARFAAARRKAEAEYQSRIDRLNNMFKQQFGQYTNPVTGQPVSSAEEYLEAFNAQQMQQQEQALEKAGLDPKLIENMVNNSPAIREAQQIIAQNQQEQARAALENDLKAVSKMDPDVKSLEDLAALPNYAEIVNYVSKNGLSLVDAYRLANGDKLAARQTEATKQAAINNAKSTSHMDVTRGVATGGGTLAPIPEKALGFWKDAYPGLSMEELTKKYNAANS